MTFVSPPRVRETGVLEAIRLVTAVGRGNTDSTLPPGRHATYQVRPPLVQIRLSMASICCAPESVACATQIPAGLFMPGSTQFRPRPMAPLTQLSGVGLGGVTSQVPEYTAAKSA